MTLNLDRSFFCVIVDYGRPTIYGWTVEIDGTVDPSWTRSEVVDLIRSREWDNVVKVIEFNSVEGWSRDITEDVLAEAGITDAPFAPMPGIDSADVRKMDMEGV